MDFDVTTLRPPGEDGGTLGTKKEERTKPAGPKMPVPDPAMFAGIPGEMVWAADPTTEADPVGVYASLLAACGAAIGRSPYVQIGNTRHSLLVWALLFGDTNAGRKGEATNTGMAFIRIAWPDWAAFTVGGLSSGEGLIERLRDPIEVKGETIGTADKRLLVTEPEFAQVMARARREGSTLAAVLRQAWDGGALSVLNRSQLTASGSHIGIIAHVTPGEFRIKLAEADMAGGTYNRFLPFFVHRSKKLPMPSGIDPEVLDGLSKRLAKNLTSARTKNQITLGQEAKTLWSGEVYDEMISCDDENAAYTPFIQRAAPYCRRIAALIAVLDGRTVAGKEDLASAAALVRYSIASAKYVLHRQARDPRLDKIRRAVDTSPDGLTRSEISALFSRNLSSTVLDELLTALTGDGEYEIITRATGGRPAEVYRRTPPQPEGA
jgi:Protein of unknown function (DUF3987)